MEAGAPPPAAPPPAATPAPAGASYAIRYSAEYKESLSRLSTIFRLILVIPQMIVIAVLGFIAEILVFIAWFAIVFTGKYPRGLFDFVLMVLRWTANVNAYYYLFRDEYPPFSGDPGRYPITLDVDYPEQGLSRASTFFRLILAIPQIVVLYFVNLLSILVVIAWFAIAFTGKYPKGIFDLLVGLQRWQLRVSGYLLLMTDEYPPFALE